MARDWLSPEDYQRLSPAERQRLWRERQLTGSERRFRRPTPRRRMPRWQAKALTVVAVVGLASAYFWISDRAEGWTEAPASLVAASGGERVHFGTCVWGGGRNCVVDGDTFYLHGEKIRIAGIDAPETHDFKCPAEKELGDRATSRLRELLNGGPIELRKVDRDHDVYGRLLRDVTVNGTDVGAVIISEGLAREYRGHKDPWC